MRLGAVIVAAGTSSYIDDFKPMLKIGGTTIVKRIITTLKQSGVDSIVIVTGNKAELLEKHISHMGVICKRNEHFSESQMFDSAKIGLAYLQNECDRIIFTPADIPLFSENSIRKLIDNSSEISCPSYQGILGHPLLISSEIVPLLLSYDGDGGLMGAIEHFNKKITEIPVEDEGILLDVDTLEDYENLINKNNEIRKSHKLEFNLQLRLSKEKVFFGPGAAEFLMLVDQTGSMQTACRYMEMSYSKAWKMVNLIEEQLGFQILTRKAGGPDGGYSQLTEQGKEFTKHFIDFQSETTKIANELFKKYFTDFEE